MQISARRQCENCVPIRETSQRQFCEPEASGHCEVQWGSMRGPEIQPVLQLPESA